MKYFVFLMLFSSSLLAQGVNRDITMFPSPEKGFKQIPIWLPVKEKEENFKVEVFVGADQIVDCNQYFMIGKLISKELPGWGYSFYHAETKSELAGTRMGCFEKRKQKKFIHLQPLLIEYNSRIPLVIYIPNNLKLKYKIFQSNGKFVEVK